MGETVLLGAGASVEAGIPAAKAMTRKIFDHISEQGRNAGDSRLLRLALGGVLFARSAQGYDPLVGADVEELFAAVEFLGQRHTHEVAAFVGSWHGALLSAEQQAVQERLARDEEEQARRMQQRLRAGSTRTASPFDPSEPYDRRRYEGQEFQELGQRMLEALADIVIVDEADAVAYLTPLVDHVAAHDSACIATLNYDNSVERAAELVGAGPPYTGIPDWNKSGQIRVQRNSSSVTLLKLHGSVNWSISLPRRRGIHSPMVQEGDWDRRRPHSWSSAYSMPGLVFGLRGKLRPDGPFLALLRAFADALHEASVLTVIGYSFRDAHINAEMTSWLASDERRRLRIIDPFFTTSRVEYADSLRSVGPPRVEHFAATASEGIARLYSA